MLQLFYTQNETFISSPVGLAHLKREVSHLSIRCCRSIRTCVWGQSGCMRGWVVHKTHGRPNTLLASAQPRKGKYRTWKACMTGYNSSAPYTHAVLGSVAHGPSSRTELTRASSSLCASPTYTYTYIHASQPRFFAHPP